MRGGSLPPEALTGPPRVLVVDDEPQVLVALRDVLEDDFEVATAERGEQALHMAEEDPHLAVILSDQRMPGMSGDELFCRLRDHSSASRILCTGYADINAVARSVNDGGIFGYVTKPWDATQLRSKVKRAADYFRLNHELAYEKQLFADLMNSIPDGIFFKDENGRYVRVNPAFLRALAAEDAASVLGRRLSDLMPGQEAFAREIEDMERALLRGGQVRRDTHDYVGPDGLPRSESVIRAAVRSATGTPIGLIGIAQDITDTIRTQKELAVSEERLRLAFQASSSALFDWNLETGEAMYSSVSTIVEASGTSASDDFSAFEQRVHPEDVPRLRAALNAHFEEHAPLQGLELRAQLQPGEYRWYELSAQAAWNSAGRPIRLVGATSDITEKRERDHRLARLDHLARHDELTNLPNRGSLANELEDRLAAGRTRSEKVALLMMDIVRFRHVNETLGKRGGDDLLIEVARRIEAAARPTDFVARFDSNAFAIVMSSVEQESEAAHWFVETLSPALAQPMSVQDIELGLTVKAGIALFPSDGESGEVLMAHAETALKQAKRSPEPYVFYAPSMNSRVAEKLRLENKLRRALEHEEFVLFYQPKVELKSGEMVGMEALIRWRDPEVGLIPPGSFIPILEETDLILHVGRWVIERAARQYEEWLALTPNVPRIAVNVSALQLVQRDFVASLDSVLSRYPRAAQGIDLELTESVLMDNLAGNIETLNAAKDRGLRVAIDDFGTGYSSLGYLSRLPLDALKIDRSFVDSMADNPQQMSIVSAIISLAHSMDLKVIAEGVETAQQAQLLRLLRCDELQGYLLARPLPEPELAKLLGTRFEIPKVTKA